MKSYLPLHLFIISVIGIALFIPFLGSVHLFDWDEINFAESAREMIITGDYSRVQINYEPFWEKPPLFIWLQVLSMKLFGINEFAARFPNALFGVITLCYIYYCAKKIFKGHLANWWVLCYLAAIFPQLYFKTGLIDPVFNFFIFVSIIQLYYSIKYKPTLINTNKHVFLSGIFAGLAILTKGPAALLIIVLVMLTIWVIKGFVSFLSLKQLFMFFFTLSIVSSLWFIPEFIKNGPWFFIEFINYQLGLASQNIAGHQQPFYYHVLVLLIGCFPISIIALSTWRKNEIYTYDENLFRTVMLVLFFVVLVLFSIVKTKIIHYSSMCWLPLTFLAAYGIESAIHKQIKIRWYFHFILVIIGIVISTSLAAFPIIMSNSELNQQFMGSIKDEFTKHNFMISMDWSYIHSAFGIALFLALFGYVFYVIKGRLMNSFGVLLLVFALVINFISIVFVPRIEGYTQRSAIKFFKNISNKDVYIFHVGYKSYAPYFYSKIKPLKPQDGLYNVNQNYLKFGRKNSSIKQLSELERGELDDLQKAWLMKGDIDKPVYFVTKINDEEDLPENKEKVRKIYSLGGFNFYVRFPDKIK